jgi:cellulose synthase (UDP-forming)
MDYLYSGTRQLFFSEIYESVQAMFLLPAIISVLLNPHKPSFKVTPKGNTNAQEVLSPFSTPFFIVIVINFIALVLAVYKWFEEPILREVVFMTGMWCVYNFYLALVSLGAFWERKQVRKFHRIQTSGIITAHFSQLNEPVVGRISDISLTGIGFEMDRPIAANEELVKLEVTASNGRAYTFECKVHHVFKRGARYSCGSEFVVDQHSYPEIVSFVFGDSQRWVDNWENKSVTKGSARMLLRFSSMGARAIRTVAYLLLKMAFVGLARVVKVSLTTMIVRDTLLNVGGWLTYRSYSILISLAGYLYRGNFRKIHRIDNNTPIEVFFPRLGATLHGQINDISLTGTGLLLVPPFALMAEEQMVLLIKDAAESGLEYRFGCKLSHISMRNGQLLYGTKFNVDILSYPKIINLVYGSNMQLLRFLFTRKIKSAV